MIADNLLIIGAIILLVFLAHAFLMIPTKSGAEDEIMIDSRLIGQSDDDLTDPKKIAYIVYKSIAIDLKNRVDSLEKETTKLKYFRNIFGFYAALVGLASGLTSLYLKFFSQ